MNIAPRHRQTPMRRWLIAVGEDASETT